jgi:hypothetical protein
MMASWKPYAARLRAELDEILVLSDALLDASAIEYGRNRGGEVVVIAPDWAWAKPTDEVRRLQIRLVPRYDGWVERFELLFVDAPDELRRQTQESEADIRAWLARDDGWGWGVPSSIEEAKAKQHDRFDRLREYLDVVSPSSAPGRVLAVPDSSALLDVPDLRRYPEALGVRDIDIYLVPGVLSEIDVLKDQGRSQDVREKARAVGRAIRDVRQQGSLLDGVEIEPGVRVFSRPQEPDFGVMPGRLDPAVPDDRILAAAFELQRGHASDAVVLVTGDINLQTKAELARLPYAEPPSMS